MPVHWSCRGARLRIGVAGWSDTSSGLQGGSELGDGVEGFSKDGNGVKGSTEKTGTWGGGGAHGAQVTGGVKGLSADVDTVDKFAVVGDARGYGVGVLGLGGVENGHGVLGVSHKTASFTATGVRGVTREGADDHWALLDTTNKGKVGVYGQSRDVAAVWGESTARVGVAGTGGTQAPLTSLPAGPVGIYGQVEVKVADPTQPVAAGVIGTAETKPGVFGWSKTAEGLAGLSRQADGVRGLSASSDAAQAGVSAEGNGASGAAALNVHDGAITVSGPNRPADTVQVGGGWQPVVSCEYPCPDCTHQHVIGWQDVMQVHNPLVGPESIILLTCEDNSFIPLSAKLTLKEAGSFTIMVTSMGDFGDCLCPTESVSVHYLIINPIG